jgi:hypothetical protein
VTIGLGWALHHRLHRTELTTQTPPPASSSYCSPRRYGVVETNNAALEERRTVLLMSEFRSTNFEQLSTLPCV